jgi:hypothetical protein
MGTKDPSFKKNEKSQISLKRRHGLSLPAFREHQAFDFASDLLRP